MNDLAKSDQQWGNDYYRAWVENYKPMLFEAGFPKLVFDPSSGNFTFDQAAANAWYADPANQEKLRQWHAATRALADKASITHGKPSYDFFAPGTERFQHVFDSLSSALSNKEEGGTRYYSKSRFYHAHGEYIFNPTWINSITLGANLRAYRPDTRGTILLDETDEKIKTWEMGAYTGFEKLFFNGKLTANAALRVDKHENFDWITSPAASLVYHPKQQQFWRFSFSAGIRNPILVEQYLHLQSGRTIFSGNLDGRKHLITTDSYNDYREKLELNKLQYFDVPGIKPEKVKSFEIGYRNTLLDKVYVDGSYFFNVYDNFLGYRIGIEASFDTLSSLPNDFQLYRISGNSMNTVTTQGFAVALHYYFGRYFQLKGNYSWNRLNKVFENDPIIPAFNTPEHKYNFGVSGRDLPLRWGEKHRSSFGFALNYKYVGGFLFESSPQFTGEVESYNLLDVQLNCLFKTIYTTLKVGASNLLNNKVYQAYGSPEIGRMAYVTLTYDFLIK